MPVNGQTRIVGVFGYPVTHSRSPLMHNRALTVLGLNWIYVPFSVDPGKTDSAVSSIRSLDLVGVNVTVPLKELIAPNLDWVDPVALKINSVNTIVNDHGVLKGYSTDGPGLLWDLADKGVDLKPTTRVLVLGAGGSARAIVQALSVIGCKLALTNRTINRAEKLLSELGVNATLVSWDEESVGRAAGDAELIINTTTFGMRADQNHQPAIIPEGVMLPGSVLYDLIYAPPETRLMQAARRSGAKAYNGLGMLVRQGALSLQLWTGLSAEQIPVRQMEDALFEA